MTAEGARAGPTFQLPPEAYGRMASGLRYGLLAAGTLLGVALLFFLSRHSGETFSQALQQNPLRGYLSPGGLGGGLLGGHAEAFLTLGILVLVATPILRVALGAYYFHRAHDATLTRISLTVLVLLVVGIVVLGPLLA
ncbi:MAG: DUF1634 domain-containing protein [Euryarchaeota archaeon]|nr:DUF1634 domain-containing protein [Euryarchaeota archaeon]MDE1836963.1 DUF1634 domain-containing protein [Euryarchaeota archaeon]MDE1880783.1 DUF1634 domain-containing protein [Euryarchaeota archaeon]MDE2045852.1 DUF1634 domain-containing protein [Thermoplasmata archaeon]